MLGSCWVRMPLLLTVLVSASAASAAPVTYVVSGGSITTIQLFALSGSVQPCPIGGSINCLTNAPLAIDGGSITIDEGALTLSNVTLSASGTGSLLLGGLFGYSSIDFSSTTLQTTGASLLGGGGGSYSFSAPATITTDLVLNTSGGPVSLLGAVFPGSPTGSIQVSGNQFALDLRGVNLGMFCDPRNPTNCVVAKADFQVRATNPIPEPSAVAAFAVGALIVGGFVTRLRNSLP
jgi:hypothetical protein